MSPSAVTRRASSGRVRRSGCRAGSTAPWPRSQATAGSTKLSDRPSRGNAGMQAAPPAARRLLHDGAQQAGAAFVGRRVQGGDRQRLEQAPVQHAGPQHVRRRSLPAAPGAGRAPAGRRAARMPGTRRPAGEHPPGQAAGIRPHVQRSPVARSMNGNSGVAGPGQGVARADLVQEAEGGAVAGQQQVVAVVQPAAERAVEVGPAAPACLRPRLVHRDGDAGLGEAERGRQPGQAGADARGRGSQVPQARSRASATCSATPAGPDPTSPAAAARSSKAA